MTYELPRDKILKITVFEAGMLMAMVEREVQFKKELSKIREQLADIYKKNAEVK